MGKPSKKIYTKVFVVYTAVIVLLIILLDLYFLKYLSDSMKDKNLYVNQQLVNEVSNEVEKQFENVGKSIESMYFSREVIEDTMKFIDMDINTYNKQKLDHLSDGNSIVYTGVQSFIASTFNGNEDIDNISIISYKKDDISTFNRRNQINIQKDIDYEKIIDKSVITEENRITYVKEISNPNNFEKQGALLFTFNMNKMRKILSKYDNCNEVFVLDENLDPIYASVKEYENPKEQYRDIIDSKEIFAKKSKYYLNINYQLNGITVIGRVDKNIVSNLGIKQYLALILMDIVVFLIAIGIISLKIKKLNQRMDVIISAMEEVKHGNLDIYIDTKNENDELAYIADSFNDMCGTLDEYIRKSYLAEINKKDAQMKALQSQINPHFLYNTLEVIRMKAICSGNKEVGKMLYNLANIFRAQLKADDIITFENEVDYCKKYLDLFKFRYEDKFKYELYCNKELLKNKVIKFIMQPLVENYLIHGIRLEDSDNLLIISIVDDEEDNIIIHIEDNGRGIPKDKLREITDTLSDKKKRTNSIGIVNVNDRIKTLYGDEYGIMFEEVDFGTKIIVKIPKR